MATANLHDFFRNLTRGMAAATLEQESDRRLVERFLAQRDEAAFEALTRRHGPMVYRVCWRVLQQPQDVEDAFQATFLVLARKLRTVRKLDSVASWLHGVARRVALKARAHAVKAAGHTNMPGPREAPADETTWKELRTVLDSELAKLPEKWRSPLVLCYLEGRTQDEAAGRLAWSKNTLRRRLDEARTALGHRLRRRGIVWPATFAAAMLSDCVVSAALPEITLTSTVAAACHVASGQGMTGVVSAKIAALAEGVLKTMLLSKLKIVAAVGLILAVATVSVNGLVYQTRGAQADAPADDESRPKRVASVGPTTGTDDLQKLQGKWKVKSIINSGRPQTIRGNPFWTISGNKIVYDEHDVDVFTLDTTKTPRSIDFDSVKNGKVTVKGDRGIYALEGNVLKMCVLTDGGERPSAFTSRFFSGHRLITLERQGAEQTKQKSVQPPKHEADAIRQEREKFAGTWRLISGEANGAKVSKEAVEENFRAKINWLADTEGRKRPAPAREIAFFLIHDGESKWQQRIKGDTTFTYLDCEGTSAIDPARNPRTIDLTVTGVAEGHELVRQRDPGAVKKGQVKRGIYEFVGTDTCRICFAAPGKERPANFSTKLNDDLHHILVFQRVNTNAAGGAAPRNPSAAKQTKQKFEDFAEFNFGGGGVSATGVKDTGGFTVVPVAEPGKATTKLCVSIAVKEEEICQLSMLVLLFASSPASSQTVQHGLKLPPGFEVTEFADSKLANDIYCMTVDARGRIVVSGRGYIRILVDDDNDGRADRAIAFADSPKDGAMGLLWEGNTLFVTGDGGLRRFEDADGDGRADGPAKLCRALKTGGEHTAHALRRGPDGWLYVLCGNSTGIDSSYAGPRSPVREPVAGCVLRLSPDLKQSEIVAHGFRNPYGMDFNADGELFTFDSDNERCVALPWYEFTRFYHVIPGGHHGWLSPQRAQTWRMPPYFADVVAPVAVLGRGSPTGVACYRHHQFPKEYRDGMFLLDWTFGRIHFVSLRRAGSTYRGEAKVFAEAVGENGFAPTAIVVHPQTGDLYVAIGGRGTRGAVYRIRASPTRQRGKATPRAGASGSRLDQVGELAREAVSADALERRRALDLLWRHHQRLPASVVRDAIRANAGHADRYICQAVVRLLELLPAGERARLERGTDSARSTFARADMRSAAPAVLSRAAELAADGRVAPELRLANMRLVQLALGDIGATQAQGTVWEGYTPRATPDRFEKEVRERTAALLRSAFPSAYADLDRELTRTLAMMSDDTPDVLGKIASRWTADSDPVDDIHYLIVLARLPAARSRAITQRVAGALLALDRKLTERHLHRDTNWPLRIRELYAELARRDPGLHGAMLAHADFGRPDHALFARVPGFDRRKAAVIFLNAAARDRAFSWNADLVQIVAHLPDAQALPVLRKLWGQAGLESALLPVLARGAAPVDRPKFVQGLHATSLGTVRLCLKALASLPAKDDGTETLALIRALGNLPEGEKSLRGSLGKRLREITGKDLGQDKRNWTDWFSRAYPELAVRLTNPDGVDVAHWEKRLAALDWSQGKAERGQGVFAKASCASCHSGSQALGPDLAGVAGRFSRADLFASILQPSRDVSPRYRTIVVETADGKIHQGLVIYEAVDSLILQTGAATTVRLGGAQISTRREAVTSLMPAGLLDSLQDRDIADLYAYLKTLGKRK